MEDKDFDYKKIEQEQKKKLHHSAFSEHGIFKG